MAREEVMCRSCGKRFLDYKSNGRSFCSLVCYWQSLRRKASWNQSELCLCGCGGKTKISDRTSLARQVTRGKPVYYIRGHNNQGSTHHAWKGDSVGYHALHAWVSRHYGNPRKCECCGTTKAGKYEWASISGDYRRERKDYLRLCSKCHYDRDGRRIEKHAKANRLFFNRWSGHWERRLTCVQD